MGWTRAQCTEGAWPPQLTQAKLVADSKVAMVSCCARCAAPSLGQALNKCLLAYGSRVRIGSRHQRGCRGAQCILCELVVLLSGNIAMCSHAHSFGRWFDGNPSAQLFNRTWHCESASLHPMICLFKKCSRVCCVS